jgi:hypothetical protein
MLEHLYGVFTRKRIFESYQGCPRYPVLLVSDLSDIVFHMVEEFLEVFHCIYLCFVSVSLNCDHIPCVSPLILLNEML